jgi:hypothetical protein
MNPKPPPSKPDTLLPPPPARLNSSRSAITQLFSSRGPVSTLHFLVHAEMEELRRAAESLGWNARGFTALTIPWLELHWTSDGWKTTHVVSSNDVPCPVVNGTFHLSGCAPETEVEFAIHVGLACHAPGDTAFARDVSDLWLNNDGKNYQQTTG